MSTNYALVKSFHDRGLWTDERVTNAVGRWITQEEADAILSTGTAT